jgi:hypothetical protein
MEVSQSKPTPATTAKLNLEITPTKTENTASPSNASESKDDQSTQKLSTRRTGIAFEDVTKDL